MPSKLRILAGYLLFWPHKNLIFSVRRHFSRGDGDSSVAEVCPPQRDFASPKDGRGMPIPQHSIASVYAVHTVGALSVWTRSTFGTALVQKPCSPLRAIPPLGSAHEAQRRVCSPQEIFSVNADRRRWQFVPSVATDCDVVDLRVALSLVIPNRLGRAPPVLNLLAAGQKLTAAKACMHR